MRGRNRFNAANVTDELKPHRTTVASPALYLAIFYSS